jgi:hypothetical protein
MRGSKKSPTPERKSRAASLFSDDDLAFEHPACIDSRLFGCGCSAAPQYGALRHRRTAPEPPGNRF